MENNHILRIKKGDKALELEGSLEYIEKIVDLKDVRIFGQELLKDKKVVNVTTDVKDSKLDKDVTLAEFVGPILSAGKISKNAEKIAVIGYYFEILKGSENGFLFENIDEGFRVMREKPGNLHRDIQLAMGGKTPYLLKGVEKRSFRLTRTGIEFVKSVL